MGSFLFFVVVFVSHKPSLAASIEVSYNLNQQKLDNPQQLKNMRRWTFQTHMDIHMEKNDIKKNNAKIHLFTIVEKQPKYSADT